MQEKLENASSAIFFMGQQVFASFLILVHLLPCPFFSHKSSEVGGFTISHSRLHFQPWGLTFEQHYNYTTGRLLLELHFFAQCIIEINMFNARFITNFRFSFFILVDEVTKIMLRKGPFKYYVIKIVGGWGWPNAYVSLHTGWVGLARCLRNQKIFFKLLKNRFSENTKLIKASRKVAWKL